MKKEIKYNDSFENCYFSIEDQIKILNRSKEYIESSKYKEGLCSTIRIATYHLFKNEHIHPSKVIIVFNKENAINFCNGRNDLYWWELNKKYNLLTGLLSLFFNIDSFMYNKKPRIKYINWCIEILEKKLNENNS